MRKHIFTIITVILILIFWFLFLFGFQIGTIRIYSYKEIASIGKEKTTLLTAIDAKNNDEYNKSLKSLQTAVQTYEKTKADYDRLSSEGSVSESTIYNLIDVYDSEILGSEIKEYAKVNNVILTLNIVQSKTSTSISSEYMMCDLDFRVSGEYKDITEFINAIEIDEKFNFEIRDFSLYEENGILRATFSVKNIPINSNSL